MDEVHERDIDIDFSLIIMKHFLKVFPQVRLVLMSATICAEKFSNYFARQSIQSVDDEELMIAMSKRFLTRRVKKEEWDGAVDCSDWSIDEQTRMQRNQDKERNDMLVKENEKLKYLGKQFLVGDNDIPAPIINIEQGERFPIYLYYLENIQEFFDDLNVKFEFQYKTVLFDYI